MAFNNTDSMILGRYLPGSQSEYTTLSETNANVMAFSTLSNSTPPDTTNFWLNFKAIKVMSSDGKTLIDATGIPTDDVKRPHVVWMMFSGIDPGAQIEIELSRNYEGTATPTAARLALPQSPVRQSPDPHVGVIHDLTTDPKAVTNIIHTVPQDEEEELHQAVHQEIEQKTSGEPITGKKKKKKHGFKSLLGDIVGMASGVKEIASIF